MFSKEINLGIIHAARKQHPSKIKCYNTWKEMHKELCADFPQIKRFTPIVLRNYYIRNLIFDVKKNRFGLSEADVHYLCYPLLYIVLNLNILVLKSELFPEIPPDKIWQYKILLEYLLQPHIFDQDIWDKMHKVATNTKEKYFVININNPEFSLTRKEQIFLGRHLVSRSKVRKTQVALELRPTDWLSSKKKPTSNERIWVQKSQSKDMDACQKTLDNDEAGEVSDSESEIHSNSEKEQVESVSTTSGEKQVEVIELSDGQSDDEPSYIPISFYERDSSTSDSGSDVEMVDDVEQALFKFSTSESVEEIHEISDT